MSLYPGSIEFITRLLVIYCYMIVSHVSLTCVFCDDVKLENRRIV